MTTEIKPLLLIAFYGDAPPHIRATFGMDKGQCPYEVVREGEKIPDDWEQALIIHHNDGYNALKAADLLVQLKALNPSGIVFMLPVEVLFTINHSNINIVLKNFYATTTK